MKLLIILFFLTSIAASAQTIYVSRIVDGDTFKDSTDLGYRLIGINAPESHEAGGPEATAFLDSLINHKYVQIVTDSKYDTVDFYKRKLCYVFLTGTDINKLMVQNGHAIVYTKYPFGKMQEYLNAEKQFNQSKPTIQADSKKHEVETTFLNTKNIRVFALIIIVILMIAIAFYYYKR
ncbi:MAG: thermonuclease family protein [Sediminibacterium sp.]